MDDDRPLESRRELENLRQRYQEHRRSVRHLLQTAPDSRIAKTYEATLVELQRAIDQLDRVDRQPPPEPKNFDPNETRSIKPDEKKEIGLDTITARPEQSFEKAELSTQPRVWNDPVVKDETKRTSGKDDEGHEARSAISWVVALIVLVAIVAAIMLAWPDRGPVDETDMTPVGSEVVEGPAVVEETPPPPGIVAEPANYDYGVIQKGTRSIHRFTVRNQTDQTVAVSVERSVCRCLWYDYPQDIPPGGSIDLAVTIDGARANAGALGETVTIRSPTLEDAVAEIDISAEIRER